MTDPHDPAADPAPAPTATLSGALAEPFRVGEPDVSGPLAVFPVFAPEPKLAYRSFAAAHAAGQVEVGELEAGASVNDLAIHNSGTEPVLLYEGEELLGAMQNRVLDVSILIAAETKTRIPVSCVEAGRWEGRRRSERFRPSRQAADPALRRRKSRRVREAVAAGESPRANQGEVWAEVDQRMADFGARSPTASMHDLYEGRRDRLAALREPIRLHDGQCGAVCAIAGEIAILDLVGRADVWADLHPALLEGYALDALRLAGEAEAPAAPEPVDPPELATVRGFTLLVGDAPAENRGSEAGIGETVRFAGGGVAGSALVAPAAEPNDEEAAGRSEEVVQLVAYPEGPGGDAGPRPRRGAHRASRPSRINRPSRRRPRGRGYRG